MNYLKYKVLKETIRFIETCQTNFFNGQINRDTYFLLTNMKFDFIDTFLREEDETIFVDFKTEQCLDGIYRNDACIAGVVRHENNRQLKTPFLVFI